MSCKLLLLQMPPPKVPLPCYDKCLDVGKIFCTCHHESLDGMTQHFLSRKSFSVSKYCRKGKNASYRYFLPLLPSVSIFSRTIHTVTQEVHFFYFSFYFNIGTLLWPKLVPFLFSLVMTNDLDFRMLDAIKFLYSLEQCCRVVQNVLLF